MADPSDTDPRTAKSVAEAAARWRVALERETANEADWLAFEQWLGADPKHQAAYTAMEDAAIDAELALAGRPSTPTAEASGANVVTLRRSWIARPVTWAAGIAAAACALFFLAPMNAPQTLEYAFAAPASADERVTLPDGSGVHLNRGAAIQVSYGDIRRIVLERGEASFTVAHDEARTFEVAAGNVLVRDIGTVFNIARNASSDVVTVSEGEVEIAVTGAQTVNVTAGYQARITPGEPIMVSAANGDAFAWQQGRLVYTDAPLAIVIEDLNRYSATPIVLDASAHSQRFSGVLILDTPEDMLARLEGFLPIRSVPKDDRIVVEQRP